MPQHRLTVRLDEGLTVLSAEEFKPWELRVVDLKEFQQIRHRDKFKFVTTRTEPGCGLTGPLRKVRTGYEISLLHIPINSRSRKLVNEIYLYSSTPEVPFALDDCDGLAPRAREQYHVSAAVPASLREKGSIAMMPKHIGDQLFESSP